MARVAALWRHPIKSHGREALSEVTLTTGQTMPWDRHWAVMHDAAQVDHDNPAWAICRNFMIGAATPGLAGIWAELDEGTGTVTLTHADLVSHVFQPDNPDDWPGFLMWVLPLCPADKRQPKGIYKVAGRGITDTPEPTISIMNTASHTAVAAQVGQPLEQERWRGNIWLDDLSAWDEFDWIGKTIRIGEAELSVTEPIQRCMHTTANPHTGQRDADTLGALRSGWDNQNFGVYAVVAKTGKIAMNDTAEVL
ncbi:MOSC domain-containing protein [Yoonia litorea]|uniref:MOSC domain-containing protein n=1 Tax=Yoonia litorea TaxID=1123755 RepID=A0A1I6L0H7_9RHOB|nr:MOSC domain-containing protein [Yoonia litorea]SFR96967.1 hypothetical protein SAMN05444714_0051 [Yoonia litorea]